MSLCMTNSKLGEPCFYVIGRTENTRLVMVPVSSPIFCLSTCLYLVFTSHSFLFIVEMIILVLLVEVVVVVCFVHSRTRCILNKAQVTFYVSSGRTDFIAEYIEVIHICNICQFGIDTSRGHTCSSFSVPSVLVCQTLLALFENILHYYVMLFRNYMSCFGS